MEFNKPIFILGHARGGSTVLASLLHWHSEVGVKSGLIQSCTDISEMLGFVFNRENHLRYSESLEQKNLWFDIFGGGHEVFTHMGKELIVERPLGQEPELALKERLSIGLNGNRLLVKSPSLSFKVKSIAHSFPGAKFIAILRRGEEVIASWGRRHYGFGKRVVWGDTQYPRLSYFRGITVFARKWMETINYLEYASRDLEIRFVNYQQLLDRPVATLTSLFEFLELPTEPYINGVHLEDRSQAWRDTVPVQYRWFLHLKVLEGNRKITRLCGP